MSYDIYLKDPVTGETAQVPGHLMTGGTYMADYHPETGTFTPALNTDAHLNITYNYSHYYYDIFEEKGIRTIYGIGGIDGIPILEKMIVGIEEKYKKNGEWITTDRKKTVYYDKMDREIDIFAVIFEETECEREEKIEFQVNESDTSDYWMSTAANALKPLFQLIALAKMRPDCVWDGD